MFSSNFYRKAFILLIFGALAFFLVACDTENGVPSPASTSLLATAVPTSTPAPIATINSTSTPQPITKQATTPTVEPCNIVGDPVIYSLNSIILTSKSIFLGEVVKVSPFIWNTPDGKAPAQICQAQYAQLAPVQVHIQESFKGDLKPNTEISLLLFNQPGSLPNINLGEFNAPLGKSIIWFLYSEMNFRPDAAANPLIYPRVLKGFTKDEQGTWSGAYIKDGFKDTDELKQLIQNPPSTPSP